MMEWWLRLRTKIWERRLEHARRFEESIRKEAVGEIRRAEQGVKEARAMVARTTMACVEYRADKRIKEARA